jgi:hypothetical protein
MWKGGNGVSHAGLLGAGLVGAGLFWATIGAAHAKNMSIATRKTDFAVFIGCLD